MDPRNSTHWASHRTGNSQTATTQTDNTRWANMGGPMSRVRREVLNASVLGEEGVIRCPQVLQVCIDWGRRRPLDALEVLFARHGISDPEALREHTRIPPTPLLCESRQAKYAPKLRVTDRKRQPEVLSAILVLALSTDYLYDPARPVLLIESRLERNLLLYTGEGFYA
jgi:hypothetical protein